MANTSGIPGIGGDTPSGWLGQRITGINYSNIDAEKEADAGAAGKRHFTVHLPAQTPANNM